jgi:hypothetical protein
MKQVLAALIFVASTPALGQVNISKVDWDDPRLVAARQEGINLLGASSGFESTGGTKEMAELRLPVMGILPSKLASIFGSSGPGLEALPPGRPRLTFEKAIVTPVPFDNRLGYSLAYQNIAEGLDGLCTGTRVVRRAPKGVTKKDLESVGSRVEDDPEISTASWQQRLFGIFYSCEVHCSTEDTRGFCRTDQYARGMLEGASVLLPGTRD